MNIEVAQVKSLIEAAYETGYWQGESGKEAYLAGVMEQFRGRQDAPEEEARLWTAEELRAQPEGTKFDHSRFGTCFVATKQGEKVMVFDNPLTYVAGFTCDGHPWDMPMRKLTN